MAQPVTNPNLTLEELELLLGYLDLVFDRTKSKYSEYFKVESDLLRIRDGILSGREVVISLLSRYYLDPRPSFFIAARNDFRESALVKALAMSELQGACVDLPADCFTACSSSLAAAAFLASPLCKFVFRNSPGVVGRSFTMYQCKVVAKETGVLPYKTSAAIAVYTREDGGNLAGLKKIAADARHLNVAESVRVALKNARHYGVSVVEDGEYSVILTEVTLVEPGGATEYVGNIEIGDLQHWLETGERN